MDKKVFKFKRCLTVATDDATVTSVGRLFHTQGAAAPNAQSPVLHITHIVLLHCMVPKSMTLNDLRHQATSLCWHDVNSFLSAHFNTLFFIVELTTAASF